MQIDHQTAEENSQLPAGPCPQTPWTPPADHTQITIKNYEFFVPLRYAEGQTLSAGDASFLNSALADKMKTAFTRPVEQAEEIGSLPEALSQLQRLFWEAALERSLTRTRRQPAPPTDPVEHEARKLAKAEILAVLAREKIDYRTLAEGVLERNISAVLAKRPDIWAEARSRVESIAMISASLLETPDSDGE